VLNKVRIEVLGMVDMARIGEPGTMNLATMEGNALVEIIRMEDW